MIAVISPAKNIDFQVRSNTPSTQPRLLECTAQLLDVMRSKSVEDMSDLMNISRQLADLNVDRYKEFELEHTKENSRPAALAFSGDVYRGLQANTFDQNKLNFAQKHLRILSGLYGLLRPLDLIQPYRLEMGTKLAFDDYTTLYAYWGDRILNLLLDDLKGQGDNVIVNLASNEYFKSIDRKIPVQVINVEFKDLKNERYKTVSFYAKKARGLMSRYIIENEIKFVEDLRGFNYQGYYLDESESSKDKLVFKRDGQE